MLIKERLGKFGRSALRGRLLLALGVDKYLPQLVFLFVMMILFIWANLGIDGTMHRMEMNKTVLENLKSEHTETVCRLTSLYSVSKVENLLKERGSELRIPTDKADKVQ